jgi:predicted AAA+ superfamily ATPase
MGTILKTYIFILIFAMKEFGKKDYTHTIYINFENNVTVEDLFSYDLETKSLITGLELYSDQKVDPNNTLLIFNEIQEVSQALSAIKYFYENAPEYHIICAGSLLGSVLHKGTSFLVEKVDFMNLYPLNFKEFLMATGNERFVELLDQQNYLMINSFKQTYIDALKQYYYVVGMLEAYDNRRCEYILYI